MGKLIDLKKARAKREEHRARQQKIAETYRNPPPRRPTQEVIDEMARDIRAFMAAFRAKIEEMEARIASNQRVLQRAVQAIAEIGKWINQKLGD